jgi:hypothetical protein
VWCPWILWGEIGLLDSKRYVCAETLKKEKKVKRKIIQILSIIFVSFIAGLFFLGCGGDSVGGGLFCNKTNTYTNVSLSTCKDKRSQLICSDYSWEGDVNDTNGKCSLKGCCS